MGGGKESKRKRALMRSGLDPDAAAKAAAKEFAAARAKQEKIEAAAKEEAKAKQLREKRKREKREELGEEGVRMREQKRLEEEKNAKKMAEASGKKRKPTAKEDEEVVEKPAKKVKGDPSLTAFVGQLPFTVDAKTLEDHFLTVGIEQVASVRMLTDKTTNKSRGMAFVQFTSEEDLSAALTLHQSELCGRWINVERSVKVGSEKPAKETKRSEMKGKIDRSFSVFVAKLPFNATAKSIREHFENLGVDGVVKVKMLSEKVTNKKGMAFVQLSNEEGVSAALELHDSQFDGRRIIVERSKAIQNDGDDEAEIE